ncbi:hypothetical protein GCM10027059_44640 [Myceligenerans halotolerans]
MPKLSLIPDGGAAPDVPGPPIAVGYARDDSQRRHVQGYAADRGYVLVHMVNDQRDGTTISQLTQHAAAAHADAVILPGDALLSAARARLEKELARVDARCIVVGAPSAPARGVLERLMPRRDFGAVSRGRHSTKEHSAGPDSS